MSLQKGTPVLLSLQKIWDEASHNSLTDLVLFQNYWYCTFREGDCHYKGNNGSIRIITSQDGTTWKSVALFEEHGVDLRDPKLSITPDNRLMLLMGGTTSTKSKKYISRQPRVAFSSDGKTWGPLIPVLTPHEWLWRITWHQNKAYGVSYRSSVPSQPQKEWIVTLFESTNGIDYSPFIEFPIPGHPNETTLRFLDNGEMIALVRRDSNSNNHAWIGSSFPPYRDWKWHETKYYFGGPNFLIFPDGKMWAAGRIIKKDRDGKWIKKTCIAEMGRHYLKPVLTLPSNGDTSYPGMVLHNGILWVSYYSSHEDDKTAVYLAKIE